MRNHLLITTLALLLGLASLSAEAGARTRVPTPRSAQFAKVWDKKNFSHRLYDSLLRRHVKRGRLQLAALRKHSLPLLREYLYRVANTDPATLSGGRAARLAFWINAHNALVIRTVLERVPWPPRPRPKVAKAAANKLYSGYAYRVGKRWFTPREILNKVLRAKYKDPRAHFVLVHPSKGGPRLWRRAFTARKVSKWLAIATRRFLRDPHRGAKLDRRKRTIHLAPLFKRYGSDFKAKPHGGVLPFVARYLKAPAARTFLTKNLARLRIKYRAAVRSPLRSK